MCKKGKTRLHELKKVLIDFSAIIFVSIALSCSVIADASEISTESSNEQVAVSKNEIADIEEESRVKEPKRHKSTMERMCEGTEIVHGDRAQKLLRAAIRRKKRIEREKAAEKARLKALQSTSNVELLAHLIFGEAGNQSDECQQIVGMVVLNRVKAEGYPNTVHDVIYQHGQYACTWDGNFNKEPDARAYKNARAVLNGNTCVSVPDNVVFQAQFIQGRGIWKQIGSEIFSYA